MQQPDNERIVDAALGMVGWPYRHAGRNEYGIDCVGLIILAAHKCGFTNYDTVNYPKRPVAADLRREMRNHMRRVPDSEMRSGDVVEIVFSGHLCHVGIINYRGREPNIIHAYAPARKVIEQTLSSLLMNKRAQHVTTLRYTGE
jgi:cell wall-associated NlpC family hydrolase